jgi:flagellar biosynthesis protein FlhG
MLGLHPELKIFTIASGKGGVGKSSIAVNLAIALAQFGIRVLVVDADFGLANIDVMLGVQTKHNLSHFLRGERRLDEIVQIGYDGVRFISGGSGSAELLRMDGAQVDALMHALAHMEMPIDCILCDAGAGITENILKMCVASSETIVVTTPEPTSIIDAFALLKNIVRRDEMRPLHVILNKTDSRREGERVFDGFRDMLQRNLQREIDCLGFLPNDSEVPKSIKQQTPVMVNAAESRYAREIRAIARVMLNLPPEQDNPNAIARWFKGK